MDCRKTQRKIDRYLRDELPRRAADEVDEHLQTCPDCREALENARRLNTMFERASTPPVPEAFAAGLRERAAERKNAILGPLPAWNSMSAPWRAAVAAGLVVGLALGIIMGAPARGPTSDRAPEVGHATGIDYLAQQPRGSINRAFLSMVSGPNGEE